MGENTHMRMICHGQLVVDERLLGELVRSWPADGSCPEVRIHFAFQLAGGGPKPPTSDAVTFAKNEMARLLLELGCDLAQTTQVVDKLVKLCGVAAIKHALRQREAVNKLSQLERLAQAHGMTLPKHNSADLKKSNANQQRQNRQQIRQQMVMASDYQLGKSACFNQDDTECKIIDTIKHAASGVMLCDKPQAEPWLQNTSCISQDELGLMILGTCGNQAEHKCTHHTIPATTREGSPVIISACLHQLGNKGVKIHTPKGANVAIESATVFAVTMFRDELDSSTWEEILKSPVKVSVDLLGRSQIQIAMITAPWGRSWSNEHGKCTPDQAKSFQYHMRVLSDALDGIFKSSGMHGVYCVPKTDSHEINKDYAIIWMDLDLPALQVTAAASPYGMGLIRVTKGTAEKTSRGIRVKATSFADAHKAFKPDVDVPAQIQVNFLAKVAPLPTGVTQESLRTWLEKLSIPAKPLKPLGPKAWMIGCATKFQEQWLAWDTDVILVTWLQEKNKPKPPAILAERHQGTRNQVHKPLRTFLHQTIHGRIGFPAMVAQ